MIPAHRSYPYVRDTVISPTKPSDPTTCAEQRMLSEANIQ